MIQIGAPPKPKRLVRFFNGKAAGAKLKFVLLEGLRRLLRKILAELKLTGLGERMYAPVFMKHIIKNDNTEAVLHVNLLVWTDGVAPFPAAERMVGVEKGKRTLSLCAILRTCVLTSKLIKNLYRRVLSE